MSQRFTPHEALLVKGQNHLGLHPARPRLPLLASNFVTVPFDKQIWSGQDCADYLGQCYSTFMKRTQYLDGFPARCKIPGQPRWQAKAVTDWALGISNDARTESATS